MLFKWGKFISAAGLELNWKIECDALEDDDWECIAELIMERYKYCEVHGVPRGGNKLAALLQKGVSADSDNCLIVDDVYTTGRSIRAMREKLMARPDGGSRVYLGCVVFARMRLADSWWVRSLFQFEGV